MAFYDNYLPSVPEYQDADDGRNFDDDSADKTAVATVVKKLHHFTLGLAHIVRVLVHSVLELLNSQIRTLSITSWSLSSSLIATFPPLMFLTVLITSSKASYCSYSCLSLSYASCFAVMFLVSCFSLN
jgi:hypothetical protein